MDIYIIYIYMYIIDFIVSKVKLKIYMAPVKTEDRSDLIYSRHAIHDLHRC